MRSSQRSLAHAENKPPRHGDPISADRQETVEQVAVAIKRTGLQGIATLLLDTFKPFSWVGGQFLYLFMPFLGSGKGSQTASGLARLLETEGSIEMLLNRLEAPPKPEKPL